MSVFFFFFFFFYNSGIATSSIFIFFNFKPRHVKDRRKIAWVQLNFFSISPLLLFFQNYWKCRFGRFCKKKVIFAINRSKSPSYAIFSEGAPRFSKSSLKNATYHVYSEKFYSHFFRRKNLENFRVFTKNTCFSTYRKQIVVNLTVFHSNSQVGIMLIVFSVKFCSG